MSRTRVVKLGLIVAILCGWGAVSPARLTALADGPAAASDSSALIILPPPQNLAETIAAVRQQGAVVTHIFPPDAFIMRGNLSAAPTRAIIRQTAVDAAQLAGWTPSARQAAAVWNSLLPAPVAPADGAPGLGQHPDETLPDAFDAPVSIGRGAASETPLPDFSETSQFFIGSAAVGIVFPESTGQTDPSTEDWTADERTLVVTEIANALNWWAEREPQAHLSFVYDNIEAETIPTAVEPINRPHSDQRLWIAETMTGMGFGGDNYFEQVRAYNNYLRETHHTDWAFTIFVVDSSADVDNRFSDSYFAYAYLGGPFMVLTYGNNGYGPSNMDAVAAHEIGHIFRALDQYGAANMGCALTSGYLGVENQNSQLGCAGDEPSIMRGQVYPFVHQQLDRYAQGQLGWRDSDGNGILDPLDVGLAVDDLAWQAADASNVLDVSGRLVETPFPSPKYRSALINTIAGLRYRVDDGPWLAIEAVDGAFDGYDEAFRFVTGPLNSGLHTITLQMEDDLGLNREVALLTTTVTDPLAGILETQFAGETATVRVEAGGGAQTVGGTATQLTGGLIVGVEYRLDGGAWQALPGPFNQATAPFEIALAAEMLGEGSHIIEARAIDDQGHIDDTPATMTLNAQAVSTGRTVFLPLVVR